MRANWIREKLTTLRNRWPARGSLSDSKACRVPLTMTSWLLGPASLSGPTSASLVSLGDAVTAICGDGVGGWKPASAAAGGLSAGSSLRLSELLGERLVLGVSCWRNSALRWRNTGGCASPSHWVGLVLVGVASTSSTDSLLLLSDMLHETKWGYGSWEPQG